MALHPTSNGSEEVDQITLPTAATISSLITFLDSKYQKITKPAEWSEAFVVINSPPEQWTSLRLELQKQTLEIIQRQMGQVIKLMALWPRSDPGHYRLQLFLKSENQDKHNLLESLQITVEPLKITAAARDELLEDLERRLPASIALSLAKAGALEGVDVENFFESNGNTLAQELVRLQKAVNGFGDQPGLIRILRTLVTGYHHILKANETWVREETARRPNLANLIPVLSRGNTYRHESDQPTMIPDTRVEHTSDTYENRLIKKYIWQVELALSQFIRSISRKSKISPNEITILQEAKLLQRNLLIVRRLAEVAFLKEVKLPENIHIRPNMVIQRKPPYRAAYEGYLDFHKRVTVKLEEPRLESPLENLPKLYQVWGTLKVVEIIQKVAADCGYTLINHNLFKKGSTDYYIQLLPDGKPVLEFIHSSNKTRIKLIPERKYIGKKVNKLEEFTKSTSVTTDLFSSSYDQQPDIVLEVYPADSTSPKVYLFDPKYKLESEMLFTKEQDQNTQTFIPKPKKVDIDKMHAYRDAIRDGLGNRVVQYAAILYPGKMEEFGEGLAALPAYPGGEEALFLLDSTLRKIFNEALSI